MRVSTPDIMMIEAFIDGELPMEEVSAIQELMTKHPELKEVYETLKSQRNLIKSTFLSNDRRH